MATQATQEITLHLPVTLYERLAQTAASRRQPLEHVITETLEISLPSPVSQAEAEMDAEIERLRDRSEAELRVSANAHLSPSDQSHLSLLLAQNREEELSVEEKREVERLLDRVERIAAERAAALWLLQKQRPEAE